VVQVIRIGIYQAIGRAVNAMIPFGKIDFIMWEVAYFETAAHQSAKLRLNFRRLKFEMLIEKEIVFQNLLSPSVELL